MPIQWLITLFALFAVSRALRAYRSGSLDRRKLLIWLLFWVATVLIVFLPKTTDVAARILGVGRGVDAVLYTSVLVLFYAFFQQSRKTDRLERSLTELVRQRALEEHHAASDRQESE
ncbi:MAG: DUF2304 family protein [Patescibacteria group bacterium]|jgi:hypothetical protein